MNGKIVGEFWRVKDSILKSVPGLDHGWLSPSCEHYSSSAHCHLEVWEDDRIRRGRGQRSPCRDTAVGGSQQGRRLGAQSSDLSDPELVISQLVRERPAPTKGACWLVLGSRVVALTLDVEGGSFFLSPSFLPLHIYRALMMCWAQGIVAVHRTESPCHPGACSLNGRQTMRTQTHKQTSSVWCITWCQVQGRKTQLLREVATGLRVPRGMWNDLSEEAWGEQVVYGSGQQCGRQEAQQMQRPWGRKEALVFKKQQKALLVEWGKESSDWNQNRQAPMGESFFSMLNIMGLVVSF